MWNALPLLSLRSFWQAAFRVDQSVVDGVATGDLQVRAHAEYTQMRTMDLLMYTNTATYSRMINMYKSKRRKQVVRGTRVNHIIKNRHTHICFMYILHDTDNAFGLRVCSTCVPHQTWWMWLLDCFWTVSVIYTENISVHQWRRDALGRAGLNLGLTDADLKDWNRYILEER